MPTKRRTYLRVRRDEVVADAVARGHQLGRWFLDTRTSRVCQCLKCEQLLALDLEDGIEVNGPVAVTTCAA